MALAAVEPGCKVGKLWEMPAADGVWSGYAGYGEMLAASRNRYDVPGPAAAVAPGRSEESEAREGGEREREVKERRDGEADSERELHIGCKVRLAGLTDYAKLNGVEGRVVGKDGKRYQIDVGGGQGLALKADKLVRIWEEDDAVVPLYRSEGEESANQDPAWLYNWSRQQSLKGNDEEAHRFLCLGLERAREPEMRSAILFARSVTLARLNRWDEALQDADDLLVMRPKWSRSFECRGAALEGLGLNAAAFAAYETAYKLDPNNQAAKFVVEQRDKARRGSRQVAADAVADEEAAHKHAEEAAKIREEVAKIKKKTMAQLEPARTNGLRLGPHSTDQETLDAVETVVFYVYVFHLFFFFHKNVEFDFIEHVSLQDVVVRNFLLFLLVFELWVTHTYICHTESSGRGRV